VNTPTPEEIQQKVAGWAKQTVVFAMNVRAIDLGKLHSDPEHLRFVEREAHRLVEQWLKDSWADAPKPAQLHELVMPFVSTTLHWVREHLS